MAYAISGMRMACEERVESTNNEKEHKRLRDDLFKETKQMMKTWKSNQAWRQATGLRALKEACALIVSTSIVNAESVPLDKERARKGEEEAQKWMKTRNEEQRALQKKRGDAAGPSGIQQSEEMEEGGEGGGLSMLEQTGQGSGELVKKRKREPEVEGRGLQIAKTYD